MRHKKDKSDNQKEAGVFIEQNISTVEAVASTIAAGGKLPSGVVFDDLVSWGVEGLMKAKDKYDPTKGAQFKTYANFRIRGEILDKIRKEWSYRSPTVYKTYQKKIQARIADVVEDSLNNADPAQKSEKTINDLLSSSALVYMLSLEDMSVNMAAENIEDGRQQVQEAYEQEDEHNVLWEEILKMEDDEKELITLFYQDNLNQKEISEILKLSRSKVCRWHQRILDKLKRRLENRFNEK